MTEVLLDANNKLTKYTAVFAGISLLFTMAIFAVSLMTLLHIQSQAKAVEEVKNNVATAVKAAFYGGTEGIGASRAAERSNFFGGQESPTFYDTSAELALAGITSKKNGSESFRNPEERLYGH